MDNSRTTNSYKIILTAMMTAIICIIGPFSFPIGIVPISLTTFAIYLTVIILGWKMGTVSCLIYLLIGLVGLPVFSGFASGPQKLMGPTGGYLIGFIFMAIISGLFIDLFRGKIYMYIVGMIVGAVVTYAFGTAWLAYYLHMTFQAALAIGVIPFIPGDIIKMVCALIIGTVIRRQLVKAQLI